MPLRWLKRRLAEALQPEAAAAVEAVAMITGRRPLADQCAVEPDLEMPEQALMPEQAPILLVERLADQVPPPVDLEPLQLLLAADERTSLRGHRRSACGRDLLLQLPRGAALRPGERLLSQDGALQVQVQAAPEPVMQVRSSDPLALLQAAYHLGNRHVAMELHADRLVVLQDPVLAELLRQRGLTVDLLQLPFQPEAGAYEGLGHHHAHSHHHP
jgi:urease accessory protein